MDHVGSDLGELSPVGFLVATAVNLEIPNLLTLMLPAAVAAIRPSATEAVDTTTAAGKMFFGMLAVLAAFERDLPAERTAAALAHKRSDGLRISGLAPFGHRFAGGVVVPDEGERAVLARIRVMRDGGMSLRRIVDTLNAEAVQARGAKWYLRSVQLALEAA